MCGGALGTGFSDRNYLLRIANAQPIRLFASSGDSIGSRIASKTVRNWASYFFSSSASLRASAAEFRVAGSFDEAQGGGCSVYAPGRALV